MIQKLQLDRAKAGFPMGEKDLLTAEAGVRKEFTGTEAVKQFAEGQRQFEAMQTMVERANAGGPGAGGVNDISLVFAFFKTIDPTSVVRESEFATVGAQMGLPSQIVSALKRVSGGGFLPPEVRQELVNLAGTYLAKRYEDVEQLKGQYQGIAQGRGLNPEFVTPDPRNDRTRQMMSDRQALAALTVPRISSLTEQDAAQIPRSVISKLTGPQRLALQQRLLALQGSAFTPGTNWPQSDQERANSQQPSRGWFGR
jgi:hypothetical protein